MAEEDASGPLYDSRTIAAHLEDSDDEPPPPPRRQVLDHLDLSPVARIVSISPNRCCPLHLLTGWQVWWETEAIALGFNSLPWFHGAIGREITEARLVRVTMSP